jgi:hypothetical protein
MTIPGPFPYPGIPDRDRRFAEEQAALQAQEAAAEEAVKRMREAQEEVAKRVNVEKK